MRTIVVVVLLELLSASAVAGAESAGCSLRKGLFDEWLASEKHSGGVRTLLKGALVPGSTAAAPDEPRQEAIGQEYQTFFQCVLGAAEMTDPGTLQSSCKGAATDRIASLVCETALYVKGGRSASKEFVEALPGKKTAELVWELDNIASVGADKAAVAAIFPPKGPAYKLLDELFLLVLDGKEGATSRYFAIASLASGEGARHTDAQIKILLREAPAVVVQEWPVLRQYQPRLKKLLSELAGSLSPAELAQMRKGLAGFCSKDNLDCPEILRVLGRQE